MGGILLSLSPVFRTYERGKTAKSNCYILILSLTLPNKKYYIKKHPFMPFSFLPTRVEVLSYQMSSFEPGHSGSCHTAGQ